MNASSGFVNTCWNHWVFHTSGFFFIYFHLKVFWVCTYVPSRSFSLQEILHSGLLEAECWFLWNLCYVHFVWCGALLAVSKSGCAQKHVFKDSLLSLLSGKGIKKFCIAHVCAHDLCLWRRWEAEPQVKQYLSFQLISKQQNKNLRGKKCFLYLDACLSLL